MLIVAAGTAAPSGSRAAEPLWVGWDISIRGGVGLVGGDRNVFSQDTTVTMAPASTSWNNREIGVNTATELGADAVYRWGRWGFGFGYLAGIGNRNTDYSNFRVNSPTSVTFPAYPGILPVPMLGDAQSATSEIRQTVQVFDAVLSRYLSQGWGELRFFGGLRFAKVDTDIESTYGFASGSSLFMKQTGGYWGVGPTAGVEATVPLGYRWRLGASLQGSLLFGHRDTDQSVNIHDPGGATLSSTTEANGGGRTAFGLDASVSLTYETIKGFYFSVGYGFQGMWGVVDTRYVDGVASAETGQQVTRGTSGGLLYRHGPFVRAGLRFGGSTSYAKRRGTDPLQPFPRIKQRFSFEAGAEARLFFESPAYPGQNPQDFSVFGQFEYRIDFDPRTRFTLVPFYRWDSQDSRRTHFDLREALFLNSSNGFEVRFGVGRVYWGVLESIQLVDIINQVDLVEDVDSRSRSRLGQPMLHVTLTRKWGMAELFVLPYFRERTFPGRGGRLRSEFVVDTSRPQYESQWQEWHPSVALRYSKTLGKLDFAAYYFYGTGREPTLEVLLDQNLNPTVVPLYQIIHQAGLEAQYTTGPWLFKWESILRAGFRNVDLDEETYVSLAGGFEYTFFRAFGTRWDLGAVVEAMWDSRGDRATTPFNHHLFVGLRIGFNDTQNTQFLAGLYQDFTSSERYYIVDFSRRIGTHFTVSLKGRFVTGTREGDFLYSIRRDNRVTLNVTYRFDKNF